MVHSNEAATLNSRKDGEKFPAVFVLCRSLALYWLITSSASSMRQ
jgi:hypothetical protein